MPRASRSKEGCVCARIVVDRSQMQMGDEAQPSQAPPDLTRPPAAAPNVSRCAVVAASCRSLAWSKAFAVRG
eukprot:2433744-Prymnesium_polylepis.1